MTPALLQRLNFIGFGVDELMWAGEPPPLRPHLEVVDEGDHYALRTHVGELEADGLTLRVGPDFLEIQGVQIEAAPRLFGFCFLESAPRELRFARRFPLHSANPLRATARLSDGYLELHIPKASLRAPAPETIRELPIAA